MEIINKTDFCLKNTALSLGKFDGIHIGHRLLLNTIMEKKELVPTVFTFGAAHGNGVMPSHQIYSKREKERILKKIGIQREICFPFTTETKNISPEHFIKEILVEQLDAKFICIGEDFHFGKNREGDAQLLKKYADVYGYELCVMPKRMYQEEVVSSTRLRYELSLGHIEMVNAMLGEPYFAYGSVVHGNERGRTFGMPTANLSPSASKILPVYGVYITMVELDGKLYPAVTNVGLKPTVGAENANIETTILDFNQDIYGKKITVHFLSFVRREHKFDHVEELMAQMEKDKASVKLYFEKNKEVLLNDECLF